MWSSPYLGIGSGGGALPTDWYTTCFTLGSSKIKVFETYFFDTVITENDHPRCVKHVLGRIHVFFRPLVVYLHVVRLPS